MGKVLKLQRKRKGAVVFAFSLRPLAWVLAFYLIEGACLWNQVHKRSESDLSSAVLERLREGKVIVTHL